LFIETTTFIQSTYELSVPRLEAEDNTYPTTIHFPHTFSMGEDLLKDCW
jgi:hypothetical protein